jgi:hypothetical protein
MAPRAWQGAASIAIRPTDYAGHGGEDFEIFYQKNSLVEAL